MRTRMERYLLVLALSALLGATRLYAPGGWDERSLGIVGFFLLGVWAALGKSREQAEWEDGRR